MQSHTKIASIIFVLGLIAIVSWRFIEPYYIESTQTQVSDAGEKGTIIIGLDGWIGYFPLCSPDLKKRMNRFGYGIKCVDDNANYDERFKKLKRDEYQFVVATVDSYLLNGKKQSYPGPIVAVLDESKGGDAIVARKSVIPNMETLKNTNDIRIAFTQNSPSHHLVKAVASHFDINAFRNSRNFISTDGSTGALEALSNNKADLAVLWEPDVTRAVKNQDLVRLLGTEDTHKLIVDILIASQNTVKNQPELIEQFLKAYFSTLKYYRNNQNEFLSDISKHYRVSDEDAVSLLSGVQWETLTSNAEDWFGVDSRISSNQFLIDSIESAVTVLLDNNDFSDNPLPNSDAYSLLNSKFIGNLYKTVGHAGGFTTPSDTNQSAKEFTSLSDKQWSLLKEVGSLKARHITFSSGENMLTLEGKQQLDLLVADLKHYPNFRIEVRGHTSIRGDAEANRQLSEDRADAVIRYLTITHDLQQNRARALGFGGTKPLPQKANESDRAYNYRLPRVEIVLLREEL